MNSLPLSPRPSPAGPVRPTPDGVFAESSALQGFSGVHRANAVSLDEHAAVDEAALVDLAITFGLIGAEFLGAVVEFLELYHSTVARGADEQRTLTGATDRAGAAYCDCDHAVAERGFAV